MTDLSKVANTPGVTAIAYDDADGILYLATVSGDVLRWNPATGTFLSPLHIGGNLSSIALTPDNAYLVLGDENVYGTYPNAYTQVDHIALANLATAATNIPLRDYEGGVIDLAVAANGQALTLQASAENDSSLREFPATASSAGNGTASNFGFEPSDHLVTSDQGRYVLVLGGTYAGGNQALYDSHADQIVADPAVDKLYHFGDINEEAGLVAEGGGIYVDIRDLNLNVVKSITLQNNDFLAGLHFSADGRELFVLDGTTNQVDILDTTSWNQVGVIQLSGFSAPIAGFGNADPNTTMTVSKDGHFLFIQVDGVLESIDLSASATSTPAPPAYQSGEIGAPLAAVFGSISPQNPSPGTTVSITGDYTVGSGQNLVYDQSHSPVFTFGAAATLTIDGSVTLATAASSMLLRGAVDSAGPYHSLIKVAAGASLQVGANGAGSEADGSHSSASVENDGLWSVSSTDLAYGVFGGGTFTNTGTFSVSGDLAGGVVGQYGAPFSNTGNFTVTGTSAALGAMVSGVNNSGHVTVTSQNGLSVAFEASGSYGSIYPPFVFSNSGTITAQVALSTYVAESPAQTPVVDLTNSGTINGDVDLGIGNPAVFAQGGGPGSQVVNTGVINGAIHFDDGNVFYNGVGGAQTGGIYLGAGTDRALLGNDGEIIYGGSGYDYIVGGSGNDTVVAGSGFATIDGGAGVDRVDFSGAAASYTVATAGSGFTVTGPAGATDTLTNIEILQFSDRQMVLGSAGEALTARAGGDILVGGPGNDTLIGGSGVDTAVYSGNYASYTVTPSGGGYTVSGPDGTDTLTNIEILKFADRQLVLGHNAETLSLQAGDFLGDGKSDFLIENTGGAVFVGESQNGQAAYTQVAGLGPEWSFHGRGDFLGNGDSDFLIQNTSGVVAVGDVHNGQTSYTTVAGLGPEWSFEGTGDFLGDGKSDFLIQNTSGVVAVGEVVSGHAQYNVVAGLGPEWTFKGAGDFLGNGKSDFLIENTAGVVAVGEVVSGQAQYTAIAGLGQEWSFKETGDFLGDGKDDFLIENTSGLVVVGEVAGGQAQYTAIASLGTEWKFVGAGDYLGEGHEQFLIENSSGAIDIGDWTGGQVHFTNIAGLGPEWAFH